MSFIVHIASRMFRLEHSLCEKDTTLSLAFEKAKADVERSDLERGCLLGVLISWPISDVVCKAVEASEAFGCSERPLRPPAHALLRLRCLVELTS